MKQSRWKMQTPILALIVLLGHGMPPAGAEEDSAVGDSRLVTPSGTAFDESGVITRRRDSGSGLVINALRYRLSPAVRVYEANGAEARLLAVKEGRAVGLMTQPDGSRSAGLVTEIWLLPQGSASPE